MRKRFYLALSILPAFALAARGDDLTPLSDEFEDASSLAEWMRVFESEGWGADQMESIDVGESRDGRLTLVPKTSSWYQDWRGILLYKRVTGDFVATLNVESRNRSRTGPPGSSYSLAGMMARAPRDAITRPSDWTTGGENYIFLSLGTGNNPGHYQFEVKSTVNSASSLEIDDGAPSAIIQMVRIGDVFLVLRRLEGEEWEVHRRYRRSDLPDTLQVGITCYTDWSTVEGMDPFQHNRTSIDVGNPDLNAAVDYFRYARPRIPGWLQDADFFDPVDVSDERIVRLFGDRANRDPNAEPLFGLEIVSRSIVEPSRMRVEVESVPSYFYRAEVSVDLTHWEAIATEEASSQSLSFEVPLSAQERNQFVRVVEE